MIAAIGCWAAIRGPAPDAGPPERESPSPRTRRDHAAVPDRDAGHTVDPRFREAVARADRLPDADEREAARLNALIAWADEDPEAAFLYLWGRRLTASASYARQLVFQRWAHADFNAARKFADGQPRGVPRETLMSLLALEAVRIDPEQAAAITLEAMAPGPIQTEAILSVAHQWGLRDRAAAAGWIAGFPAGDLRERALREVAGPEQGLAEERDR